MAAQGVSIPIIGKTLGHKSQQTTAIYARLNLDPVKSALGVATAAMAGAAQPAAKGKGKTKAKKSA